jgi:small GTP-binding protein
MDDLDATIGRLRDEAARSQLHGELATLRGDRENRRFHVVVFGTGSAGKTSLINALLGQDVGKTAPTLGTTRAGECHSHTIEGVEGTLVLTDTPGLSEAGREGAAREEQARQLAARADLLLFVLDQDLTRTERDSLELLTRLEKQTIVVLNKKDLFNEPDLEAILDRLRDRLAGVVRREDIVAVAAAPRPIPVRVIRADGRTESALEYEQPDIEALEERIAAILEHEGDSLRAGNLLLRSYLLRKMAQLELDRQRQAEARGIVDHYQWVAASAVFANPVPELDMVAAGAVEYRMISEIAAVYGADLSSEHVRLIAQQMIEMLIRRKVVTVITAMISGLFKTTLVAYAAAGAVEAVTIAYLTHVTGHVFLEYFRRGQDWGEGGMQAALARQLDATRRTDFLKEFAGQAFRQFSRLGRTASR